MMELIVLGHIPGTSTEITFTWVMLLTAGLLLLSELKIVVSRHRQMGGKKPLEEIAL